MIRGLLALCFLFWANCALADQTLKIATWKVELGGKGPGVLLRDIASGTDPRLSVIRSQIKQTNPDIILLTSVDTDLDGFTPKALADYFGYRYAFSRIGNAAVSTEFDLDRDGRLSEAEDAQAFGDYLGQYGMVLLSQMPMSPDGVTDLTHMIWSEIPRSSIPLDYFDDAEAKQLRLSTAGHWDIEVKWNDTPLNLFAFSASSPVFDGDEDRNGARNADEIRLWQLYLNGELAQKFMGQNFVILGSANLDPIDGDGRHTAIKTLLSDPRIQDPIPQSSVGKDIANIEHRGPPEADTANWRDPIPGNLRVDYVLPSKSLTVVGSGLEWANDGDLKTPIDHALVWVEIAPLP